MKQVKPSGVWQRLVAGVVWVVLVIALLAVAGLVVAALASAVIVT